MTMVNLNCVGLKPLKVIGNGSDGIVIKAMNIKTGGIYAVKIVSIENQNAAHFEREAMNVLSLSNNKYIVKAKGYHILTKEYGAIIMEYIKGDLMDFFLSGKLNNEKKIKEVFYKMCKSVEYCHSKNIAHLDIKPENFLYNKSKNQIKLCDFHHSFQWRTLSEKFQRFYNVTSINYRAPEIPVTSDKYLKFQMGEVNVDSYSLDKVDVWCLGVCLFGFFFSEFPFQKDEEGFIHYDYSSFLKKINSSHISDAAKDLILCLLSMDPKDRPVMSDVISHPFFSGCANNYHDGHDN